RPAYGRLPELVGALGAPQVLALTATARDEAFHQLVRALGIDAWVIDATRRDNLHVVDCRNTRDKLSYLQDVVRGDGKTIVYCNSKREATSVAVTLRRSIGDEVAFYHAGMPSAERGQVEEFFRAGALRVVVATSAFGEGIDLPDVRNVVLYHLNFHLTEFNQQAGRAGRDGADARIHLLFGDADRGINDFLLDLTAPSYATLKKVYPAMKALARKKVLRQTYDDVARTLDIDRVRAETIAAAVQIFADMGLVVIEEDEDGRYLCFLEVKAKVEVARSARFAEGEAERASFEEFCKMALGFRATDLEQMINRPIYPGNVPLLR
ncbi:MAG: single-stranded-DNA-specific exonuclease RecJ, partial [Candidatus Eremiobacteraeota bacterium]|nr:single-stranded-DNA-specific exonuclease RecJ [Candidatus Eremiobacteraeota bacterium]